MKHKILLISLVFVLLISFVSAFVIQFENNNEVTFEGKILSIKEFGSDKEWKVIKYFDGKHKTIYVQPENAGRIIVGGN